MSELPIYRNRHGKIKDVRKKDIRVLLERYKDPIFRARIGEKTAAKIDILVAHDLDYLLRGGRIDE